MNAQPKCQRRINRRRLLVVSCGASFALILHRSVVGAANARAGPRFVETTCAGGKEDNRRILIAYASRYGSTGSVAESIGEVLCATGAAVDVRLAKNVQDLGPYQAVIAGSAIHAGKWLPEATAFVKSHRDALARMTTAYFVVCLTMKDDTPENRAKALAYLDPVRNDAPDIEPVAVGLFPGVVDFSTMSFMHRSMLQARGVADGNYRNVAAERAWASAAAPTLVAVGPRQSRPDPPPGR